MEQASNIAWLILTLIALAVTLRASRRGSVRVSSRSGLLVVLLICFLLLPVISVSDDLIEARQAALPLSAQTWHMASEGASVGLELVSVISACLLLFLLGAAQFICMASLEWTDRRQIAAWLARSQRLRPPPSFAR